MTARARAEYAEELVGVTVEQIVAELAAATTRAEVERLEFVCLLRVGWEAICQDAGDGQTLLRHITRARGRAGLVDSETERKALAAEAEQRLIQHRNAVRTTA